MASTPIRGTCAGCASTGSGEARRLKVRLTMTPTVLHHMIILSLLLPMDAERSR
jgi:hypothetical protein